MQLVSAIEPENEEQVQFAWSLSISDGVDMIFKLEFEKPRTDAESERRGSRAGSPVKLISTNAVC